MKLKKDLRTLIENATVRTIGKTGSNGQGVLIPGGYIVTAAHCAQPMFSGDKGCDLCAESIQLGDPVVGEIETKTGKRLTVEPVAWDPITDFAVLCGVDDYQLEDEIPAFDEFITNTEAVDVFSGELPPDMSSVMPLVGILKTGSGEGETSASEPRHSMPFEIYILSHKGNWITGQAQQRSRFNPSGVLVIRDLDHPVEGGTSGGPVVNANGELVGVISNTGSPVGNDAEASKQGSIPYLPLALPGYLWKRISAISK